MKEQTGNGESALPAVLIVDDNTENLLALEAVLRRDDVDIVTASSGRAALEVLLERDIAVAIIDVMMPEIDGFELAELIRGVDRTRRVPIIFVTAGSKADAERRVFTGYETGAIDFLFKPLSDRVLRAKVDVLVSLEKQRRKIDSALQLAERSRRETQLLFRLAQTTSQCVSPADVNDPALDAVRDILGADPAAILLVDDDGVMRLGASNGLSDADRALLEQLSPWPRGERDPQPIWVSDIPRDEHVAAYRSFLLEKRVRALGFVPLVSQGELLGTFLLCWNGPRAFSEHETNLALTIASHIAVAIERLRLREAERSACIKAEAAEQKLRVALDAGRMGVWEWAVATDRVTWSPTLEAIRGLEPGRFPGTFEAFQREIHPEDRDLVLGVLRETLARAGNHHVEYRIVRPDGAERWMANHAKVLCDAQGRPLSMIGVSADVTERKELERAREAMVAELEQTLRYNEIFAGILAHDLRNPLGAIATAVQVMRLGCPEEDGAVPWLDRILASSARMQRMIDQLLDFTRARVGGGIELDQRDADLARLCSQAAEELEVAHPEWKIKLGAIGDCNGIWDPDRLLQVASNLVANAGQHGAAGGDIVVDLDGSDPDWVTMQVRNKGTIRETVLQDLFSPFRATREPRSGGLGLGLYITRELVVSHGGTIEVSSSRATGTAFQISLPRHAPSAPPVGDPLPASS